MELGLYWCKNALLRSTLPGITKLVIPLLKLCNSLLTKLYPLYLTTFSMCSPCGGPQYHSVCVHPVEGPSRSVAVERTIYVKQLTLLHCVIIVYRISIGTLVTGIIKYILVLLLLLLRICFIYFKFVNFLIPTQRQTYNERSLVLQPVKSQLFLLIRVSFIVTPSSFYKLTQFLYIASSNYIIHEIVSFTT